MAILYRAALQPTKPELAQTWLDRQSWGGSGPLEVAGSYRFDDPAGQVGVEVLLVRRDGALLQVPLTYRPEPLDGGDAHLISTMEHSVLGRRWVYAGAGDPVAVACFERALAGEQEQAALEVREGEQVVDRPAPDVRPRVQPGSGAAGGLRLAHVVGEELTGAQQLVARWAEGEAVVAAR